MHRTPNCSDHSSIVFEVKCMQNRNNLHGAKTPRLFGILGNTSIKSRMTVDADRGVNAEEININVIKAKVERTRAEALQASRLTIL
jgi:hypothetical protein